ncbi:TonB-dependent receptor [Pontibacter harenae]|uniref:TonB-dependent receptor n=1 Tax=Pontibacter harenae TaxID=2894083 RepID=UPI001E3EA2FC|nr:TonB-dependent receptor [Pontibacter harenae]MCC9166236.1 TonB-dependent receptor [Pontibacter harenae]
MKRWLVLLFSIVSFSGFCQMVTVVDKTSWLPLAGVTVTGIPGGNSVQTDANGKAVIAELMYKSDSLRFTYLGFQSKTMAVAVVRSQEYRVALVPEVHDIGEVVISAGRFLPQKQVPQQVEVLQAREIAFASQPTTADLLQQTGKVLVQKSQMGGGSPVIRGFEANKVLLVVDGVRMNNAIYRGGHLQNIITIDNSVLERTEVLFGPNSVMYGSDALGGVIHFYTKRPQLATAGQSNAFSGEAYTRYGTAANEFTAHAQANYGRSKWASFSGLTYTSFGNLRQGANRSSNYGDLGIRNYYAARTATRDTMLLNPNPNVQRPTGYKQYDLIQKVLFEPNRNISHQLNLQYSTSTDIPRYDRLTEMTGDGELNYAEWYYGPQDRFLASYSLALKDTAKLYDQARVVAALQRLEESRHNRRFGRNGLSHREEEVWVYSLAADFSKQLQKHRLQYGVEANYNDVASEATEENIEMGVSAPISTRYPDGGATMQSLAAFLSNTWSVSPKIVLTQGVRAERVSLHAEFKDKTFFPFLEDEVTQHSSAVTGSVGGTWLPSRDWRFSLVGASGFRAPNVDDLSKVFDSAPGIVLVPNPDVKPEYTYTVDMGVSKSFADILSVEVVGYYTWYRDALVVRPFQLQGQDSIEYEGVKSQVMANVNASNAYIYGYSASVAANITSAIVLKSTFYYTYGRVKEETGDVPLDHIPPFFGKTSLYLNLKKLQAEFFVLYNGQKTLRNYSSSGEDNLQYATPTGMPAWYTLNVRTAYQLTPHLQLQAALENITDRYYRVFASGISAPGRNFVVTLRGSF